MKRLDLIIDALSRSVPVVWTDKDQADRHMEALSAARELREMEPVAWVYQEYWPAFIGNLQWFDDVQFVQPPNDPECFRNITPLYALGDDK